MDLRRGWDFSQPEDRRRAWKRVEADKPLFLIGSTPGDESREDRGRAHVVFCRNLYRKQLRESRHFLHVHDSCQLGSLSGLLEDKRVSMSVLDADETEVHRAIGPAYRVMGAELEGGGLKGLPLPQMHGPPTLDDNALSRTDRLSICSRSSRISESHSADKSRGHARPKTLRFLSSSWSVLDELKSSGDRGQHREGSSQKIIDAISKGMIKQRRHDEENWISTKILEEDKVRRWVQALTEREGKDKDKERPKGNWPKGWTDKMHEEKQDGHDRKIGALTGNEAYDDVTGGILEPDLVRAARKLEMDFFNKMAVYDVVEEEEQRRRGGKVIDLKWIDVNKGDSEHPDIRSRLVGREFNQGRDDSLYASTPPLEAMRAIASYAASGGGNAREVMVNDVRRAYFYAKIQRLIYVRLPPEDPNYGKGKLGRLRLCLYGTRDAAKGWQDVLSEHLIECVFTRGKGFPSIFHHAERSIRTLVHGDDYLSSGSREDLDWLQSKLESKYDLKTQRVGGRRGCTREGKVLNRLIRQTKLGWELEADPRHGELIIEHMDVTECKGVATPLTDELETPEEGEEEKLEGADIKNFRGVAARANYLAQDRPDLQYAVKETCREMSAPSRRSLGRLRRIARYIKAHPRLVWKYDVFAAGQPIREIVYMDALTNEVVLRNSIIKHAYNFGHDGNKVKATQIAYVPTEEVACKIEASC